MRIKRLELQGFKSFKDKTVINFDAGITGIVGPNGCGKSNVVDAFFWALGEMNARNLRGQNMEDLIFAGSTHAPASNVAEVNLILEIAADLSGPSAPAGASIADLAIKPLTREVAVTRRLFRNGESEYLINKVPCRLRDIQELFMDTGAGARGYSIIQQGKIAEIVNAKPDERRTMIEDVAGVVKYKARRREAQRKLESTNQNLLRVSDILTEIEGRRKQMERQAEKARRYKEWREQLQALELRHSAVQWEEIAAKLGSWDRDLAELEAQDIACSTERETADLRATQKKLEAVSAEKIAEEMQAKWLRESQELSTAENSLQYQTRVRDDLGLALEAMATELSEERLRSSELEESLASVAAERAETGAALDAARSARAAAEQESREKKQALEQKEQATRALHDAHLRAASDSSRSSQKVFSAETRRSELERRSAELAESLAEQTERKQQNETALAALQAELSACDHAAQSASQKVSETIDAIRSTRSELESAGRELRDLEREELLLASSVKALEDQRRRFEGSSMGVQKIFQTILPSRSELQTNVRGTLASLIKVAPGLEMALELALGPHLETVLVEDSATLLSVAESLRSLASGRANFADLSQVQALATAKPTAISGARRILDDVELVAAVNDDARITILLEYLLGSCYLAPDLDSARSLGANHANATFVSPCGAIVRGNWFMAAGDSSQISGALVARNREIQQKSEQLEILGRELATKRATYSEFEAKIESLTQARASFELASETARNALAESRGRTTGLEAELRQISRSLETCQADVTRLANEIAALREQEESARLEAHKLEEDSARLLAEWEAQRANLPMLQAEAEAGQTRLGDARVQEASLQEQINSLTSQENNAKANLDRALQRQEHLSRQQAEKSSAREHAAQLVVELTGSTESLRISIITAEANYRESRERLDEINAELDSFRNIAESTNRRERDIKDKLSHIKLQVERTLFERQNIAQNVFDRYGIDMGEYVANPEVREQLTSVENAGPDSQKELETEVMRLKEKIRKLGDVNPAAIEEFEELTTRFQFLAEQKQDLEKSIKDLESTIEKINRISRERFFRAFHEVNSRFKQVFPALFGGGMAELTLTAPDDFNETGVDIVAQPPGKKLQNINLLSGGEKTLTAISLLFAIFLVKPSPFCLLDEVDAPLDDANIGRFNALLREMAKTSQFIIITHNKRTMELNDKLYGVTMEDAGVSKMVSIQMAG